MALLVAIYGALLSTALALAKIIPEWPIVTLTASREWPDLGSPSVTISVFNPARRALFIEGNKQFPRTKAPFRITEQRELNRDEEIVQAFEELEKPPSLRPRLYVPAQGTAFLTVSIADDDKRLVLLWWHRNWLVPLCLPAFVRVSSAAASLVNRRSA